MKECFTNFYLNSECKFQSFISNSSLNFSHLFQTVHKIKPLALFNFFLPEPLRRYQTVAYGQFLILGKKYDF